MRGQVSKNNKTLHKFHHMSLVTLLALKNRHTRTCTVSLSMPKMGPLATISIAHSHMQGVWIFMEPEVANSSRNRKRVGVSTSTPTCVHKDLNSHNIFLDKNFQAKIFFWTRIFKKRFPILDWPNAKQMLVLVCRSGSKLKEEGERLLGKGLFLPSPSDSESQPCTTFLLL